MKIRYFCWCVPGARTRTEGVGGLYGIQFHYGHISVFIKRVL